MGNGTIGFARQQRGKAILDRLRTLPDLENEWLSHEEAISALGAAGWKAPHNKSGFMKKTVQRNGIKLFCAEEILEAANNYKEQKQRELKTDGCTYKIVLTDQVKKFYVGVAQRSNCTLQDLFQQYLTNIAMDKIAEIDRFTKQKTEEFYGEFKHR